MSASYMFSPPPHLCGTHQDPLMRWGNKRSSSSAEVILLLEVGRSPELAEMLTIDWGFLVGEGMCNFF